MLLVDPRVGSKELLPDLESLLPGEVKLATPRLNSCDFAFEGVVGDSVVLIGIERKRLHDLMDCMFTKRLSIGQLPKIDTDYSIAYIIVEDEFRRAEDGRIEVRKSRGNSHWMVFPHKDTKILYSQVDNYLSGVESQKNVIVRRTRNSEDTVNTIYNLYEYWQKPEHNSLGAIKTQSGIMAQRMPIPRIFASLLPGIGDGISRSVYTHFKRDGDTVAETINRMCNALPSDWKDITWETAKGKRHLGEVTALKVWEYLHGKAVGW